MASKPPPELTGPPIEVSAAGVSLRDYFAGQALVTMLQKSSAKIWNINEVAKACYTMADAMVVASVDTPSDTSPPIFVQPMKK